MGYAWRWERGGWVHGWARFVVSQMGVEVMEDRMNASGVFAPAEWAERQFGAVELGDVRRRRRAVVLAGQMARHPAASLPDQAGGWSATKAGYRLFDRAEVTFEALQSPHWQMTRQAASACGVVLMIEDTTELDFTPHRNAAGLGPIGDGGGCGLLLHSTLAVDPEGAGRVLGLAYQMVFCRRATPEHETRTQRKQRRRESQIWPQSVEQVGACVSGAQWVHVCDRYADNFEMFAACRREQVDFLIRVAQDRRVAPGHQAAEPSEHLLQWARSLPAAGRRELAVRSRPQRQARRTRLSVAFAPLTVFPPWLDRDSSTPLRCWVVRVWEASPPAEEEPIEWVLLTSVPVEEFERALTMSHWYSLRWLVEEYHKCLKTGCAVEKRQLQHADRLEACIGMLALVAVRLLQLKLRAKADPDCPALEAGSADHVRVLAAYRRRSAENWTVHEFWREVAKLGGFLARKSDGDPGWQTLWRGWQKLDLMTLGASLTQTEDLNCG